MTVASLSFPSDSPLASCTTFSPQGTLDGNLPIPQAGFILKSDFRVGSSFSSRLLVSNGEKNPPHFSITCEATPTKRADSAAKRAR